MATRKRKNTKTKRKNSRLKKTSLGFFVFLFKHKILTLSVILAFIVFFIVRKEEIIYALKDTAVRIIHIQKPTSQMSYKGEEGQYLTMLRNKYAGYGRKVSLEDTKKAVADACLYIKNIEQNDFWDTPNARDLLLATAVTESDLRARYSQYGGNAVGIFQIEYITFKDLWHRSIPKTYPKLYKAMQADFGEIDFEMLQNNDILSAIFARLVYSRAKTRIPYRNDVQAQAQYYKKHYNTHLGKANTNTFVKKKNNIHKF
ncbi:MAG: hypothetical protein R3Y46_02160 [Opitutales bacterium]